MPLPPGLKRRLREIQLEMAAPPHRVRIDGRLRTSYADLERREAVLARRQLRWVDWIYRHELEHLKDWPRTVARDLYWQAKVANRIPPEFRDLFRRWRRDVMNVAYDAIIDWEVRGGSGVRECIKEYVRELPEDARSDPTPCDAARLMIAGEGDFPRVREMLERRDVVGLAVEAFWWFRRNRRRPPPGPDREVRGRPTPGDFVEAAADLIREGESLDSLDEIAREEGVDYDEERAALKALVKSYEWYLSASRSREVRRAGRARQSVWCPGDSPEKLDVSGSLTAFPKVIPGLTAVKREPRLLEGFEEPLGFRDVAILVDESGSMSGKEGAVRAVGVSILGLLNRRRVQYQVIGFGVTAAVRVRLGFDYTAGVRYFARMYSAWQDDTRLAPALEKVRGRGLLVYVISDAWIHDLDAVSKYRNMLREVVLVLIDPQHRQLETFTEALKGVPVRGYWLHPDDVDSFLVRELGRLA